jgi:hypothetical protein
MDTLNYYTISGLLILILDIWAIINILNSSQTGIKKLLWIAIVFFLPVLGFIAWLLIGPNTVRTS